MRIRKLPTSLLACALVFSLAAGVAQAATIYTVDTNEEAGTTNYLTLEALRETNLVVDDSITLRGSDNSLEGAITGASSGAITIAGEGVVRPADGAGAAFFKQDDGNIIFSPNEGKKLTLAGFSSAQAIVDASYVQFGATGGTTGTFSFVNNSSTSSTNPGVIRGTTNGIYFASGTSHFSGNNDSALYSGDAITFQKGNTTFFYNKGVNGGAGISVNDTSFNSDRHILVGNTATTAGGAFNIGGKLNITTNTILTSSPAAFFIGNTAGTDGGAIAVGTLEINGGLQIYANNTATGRGGAIYSSGVDDKNILYAKDADILFRGNSDGNGANAISSVADLQVDAKVGRSVYFYDPINVESDLRMGDYTDRNDIPDNDVTWGGRAVFDMRYQETDKETTIGGDLYLGNKTSLVLAGGAALTVTGDVWVKTITNPTIVAKGVGNKITADGVRRMFTSSGFIYGFDLAGAEAVSDVGSGDPLLTLDLASPINDYAPEGIDLQGFENMDPSETTNVYFALLHQPDGSFSSNAQAFTVRDESISLTRVGGASISNSSDGKTLGVQFNNPTRLFDVTWNTSITGGTWNATSTNWTGAVVSGSETNKFLHGDSVLFTNASAPDDLITIIVQDAGVRVADNRRGADGSLTADTAGMNFEGGTFLIQGGNIEGRNLGILAVNDADGLAIGSVISFLGTDTNTRTLEQRIYIDRNAHGQVRAGDGDEATRLVLSNTFDKSKGDLGEGGGAIYGNINSNFVLTGYGSTASVLVAGNTTVGTDVHGGAIYMDTGSTLILGNNTTFIGNHATGNGGAIFSKGKVIAQSAVSFLGNTADGEGGAIYGKDVELYASDEMIFRGNRDKNGANAIVIEDVSGSRFTAGTTGTIYLYDPVSRGTSTQGIFDINKQSHQTGRVVIDMSDHTTATGTNAPRQIASTISGIATVYRGTLALLGGTDLGVTGQAASSFTLNSGATLETDAANNRIQADAITLSAGSTLLFDASAGEGRDSFNLTLKAADGTSSIIVGGASDAVNIDINRLGSMDGVFGLMDTGKTGTLTDDMVDLNLSPSATGGRYGIASLQVSDDGQKLYLVIGGSADSAALTWVGGTSAVWNGDSTLTNWTDDATGGTAHFKNGDAVTFSNAGQKKVVSVEANVNVAGMKITGGDYTFNGQSYTIGSTATTSLTSPTQKLNISGGTAEFNTSVNFTNGLALANATANFNGTTTKFGTSGAAVGTGGVLRGTGGISGPVSVASGGTVAPGRAGSLGTLNVDSATFASGSTFRVRLVEHLGAANGVYNDSMASTGAVTIDSGATLEITNGGIAGRGWDTDADYTILTSQSSIDNIFGNVTNRLAFLDITQELVNGNSLVLHTAYNGQAINQLGGNDNQTAVSDAIATLPGTHTVKNWMANSSESEGMHLLTLLSGEAHATVRSSLTRADNAFGRSMVRRFTTFRREQATAAVLSGHDAYASPAYSAPARSGGIWAEFGGSYDRVDATREAGRATLEGVAVTLGAEGFLDSGWFGGVSFRYADRDYKVKSRSVDSDIDSYSFALYGGRDIAVGCGSLRFTVGGGFTRHDIDSKRNVMDELLKADYHANSYQAYGEIAYGWDALPRLRLEPYVGLSGNSIRTGDFSESGGAAALRSQSSTEHTGVASAGMRFESHVNRLLALNLDLGYEHAIGNLTPTNRFAFRDGSASFNVLGGGTSRHQFVTEAGFTARPTERLSIGLHYQGAFGNDSMSHGGKVSVGWSF